MQDVLLRWTLGSQDTTSLADFKKREKFEDMVWLCKMSILSFQKWFPESDFILLYNGRNYDEFTDVFDSIEPQLWFPIERVDQLTKLQENPKSNPYHFWPKGVWWKWIPFRLDISKHEIAIDTDIVCVDKPTTWYKWIEGDEELLVAPERYKETSISTTGDFHTHPLLKDKKPFNCGIVGQRKGCDFADRFFDVTKAVEFGSSHNSLFITEQGAINVWLRSLELEGIRYKCLDPLKNAWARDFLFFLENGIKVETIHAVAWHKEIMRSLSSVLEDRIKHDTPDDTFKHAIISAMEDAGFYQKYVLMKQLGEAYLGSEFLISKKII